MIQLSYISTARQPVEPGLVDAILAASRRNNPKAGLTGLLLFNGRRFLQVIEGEAEAVRTTYQRIAADPRHFAMVRLGEREIDSRDFGDWDMAYREIAAGGDLAALAEKMTGSASATVRALFTSYAAI